MCGVLCQIVKTAKPGYMKADTRTSQFIWTVTTLEFFFFWLIWKRTSISMCAMTYIDKRTNQTAQTAVGTTASRNPRLMLMSARKRARRPRFLWNNSQKKRPLVLISFSLGGWGRLLNKKKWKYIRQSYRIMIVDEWDVTLSVTTESPPSRVSKGE